MSPCTKTVRSEARAKFGRDDPTLSIERREEPEGRLARWESSHLRAENSRRVTNSSRALFLASGALVFD